MRDEEVVQIDAVERPLSPSVVSRLLGQPALLDQLFSVVVLLDADMRCVYGRGELAGRRDEQLVGENFPDLLPGECHARFRDAFACIRDGGPGSTVECGGDEEPLGLHLSLLPNEHWVLVCRTGAAMHEQRERTDRDRRRRYALEASGVGTWSWERFTDTIAWDDRLCRIYGLEPGRSPRVYNDYVGYLHPEDRPRIEAQIGRCLETGVYEDFEHRIIRPDGEVRHVFCRGAAEVNARGEVVGMSGGIFDITDRKRLEEQLRHVQKMEAIGQLAAGIAHNFNNLLSIVLPNAELCRQHAPESLLVPLADIEHAALRASEMVRQLMLFARHEVSSAKGAVDIKAVAERTFHICRSTFDRRITLELFVADDLPPVHARAGEIEQVLLNICINARDALEGAPRADPRIEMHVERGSANMVRIRIADNGPGIDDATRVRLFEPFFTTKEVGHGTGLGLASAYGILLDHHGSVRCRSTPGAGSVFIVELPVASGAVEPNPPAGVTSDSRGDETILLIDDEPLVRRALAAMLENAGFRVLEAGDGREGLQTLQHTSAVQLVVLDRSMPHMSGDELLPKLRALRPELPVIVLSGHPGTEAEVGGPFAEIAKPPRSATLLGTIRKMLDEA
ncbi:MAG TPA: ATP-binding protein [Polyangiales bacterium]|nr:ATP-binding protein [Polyangiales bacterium]